MLQLSWVSRDCMLLKWCCIHWHTVWICVRTPTNWFDVLHANPIKRTKSWNATLNDHNETIDFGAIEWKQWRAKIMNIDLSLNSLEIGHFLANLHWIATDIALYTLEKQNVVITCQWWRFHFHSNLHWIVSRLKITNIHETLRAFLAIYFLNTSLLIVRIFIYMFQNERIIERCRVNL